METKVKKALKSPYFYFILLFPLGLLLILAARTVPGFGDFYFENIYRPLAGFLGSVTGLFPFSFMEIAIGAGVFFVFFWIYRLIREGKNGKKAVLKYFYGVLKKILSAGCALFFLFAVFSGTNYYREGFAEKTGLGTEKYSVRELYDLCESLIAEASEAGALLEHDENGATVFGGSDYKMAKLAREEFQNFAAGYDFMSMGFESFGTPKPVFFSKVMSYLLISGVYSPYTLEANVCTAGPDFLRGSTMMHEQCHVYGFMNEAEANFMAYLACAQSGDAFLNYSGACLALLHSMNALYSADYELWEELRVTYPSYIEADMQAQNAYVDAYDTKVAEVSDKVNDAYLKLNDQKDGVYSYGKMVDLLLAYRRAM